VTHLGEIEIEIEIESVDARTRDWPELATPGWEPARKTLHLWTQIIGKTRLALCPMLNHWWQTPLYVSTRGLTTSPMPFPGGLVEIEFDLLAQALQFRTSGGELREMPLAAQTVSDFFRDTERILRELAIPVRLRPVPVEIPEVIPFAQDDVHHHYDPAWGVRFWTALRQVDRLYNDFRGEFLGKASPSHFFWGSFDLATTRFSGRAAPPHPGGLPNTPDFVTREAYSHQLASTGFWPGGFGYPEAIFYSYAYPEPRGFSSAPVGPSAAHYDTTLKEFVLPYSAVRDAPDPAAAVREFLETTYEAAAVLGDWDRPLLERSRAAVRIEQPALH
jgi:hypothetical protein